VAGNGVPTHDWDYTFIFDFGGSTDGFPLTTSALPSGLENAFPTYTPGSPAWTGWCTSGIASSMCGTSAIATD
jgi:hypothetical protein